MIKQECMMANDTLVLTFDWVVERFVAFNGHSTLPKINWTFVGSSYFN